MKPLLIWLLLCLVWGTTWIFIKIGLDDLPPVSFAALRFIVAALILFFILKIMKIELPKTKRQWSIIAVSGFLQFFINYGLLFWGEQYVSSGLAAVLQATIPAFGLFIAWFYLPDEKITFLKIVSILLGLFGLAVIFNDQLALGGKLAFLGGLAVVVGAFCASYASVLTKAYGENLNPASLVFSQMIIGVLPLTIAGFAREGNPLNFHWTWSAVICVLYLAVFGSILAFWLYFWLLTKMDVTKAMMIAFVTPMIAVIIGSIYRGETLALQTILGGFLILASVALVVVRPILNSTKQI